MERTTTEWILSTRSTVNLFRFFSVVYIDRDKKNDHLSWTWERYRYADTEVLKYLYYTFIYYEAIVSNFWLATTSVRYHTKWDSKMRTQLLANFFSRLWRCESVIQQMLSRIRFEKYQFSVFDWFNLGLNELIPCHVFGKTGPTDT